MTNILVVGFYNKANIGDELFKDAFKQLFPQHSFTFVDRIDVAALADVQFVIFGGGSLLDGKPAISADALELLKTKTLLYIGVGAETAIHPIHIELIKQAKLVALRSNEGYEKVRLLCINTIVIPDLVFALTQRPIIPKRIPGSILVLPNISVVPNWQSKHWEHTHFENLRLEFSQVLDSCIEDGYTIRFLPFSTHPKSSDNAAATEIINSMKWRNENYKVSCAQTFAAITEMMSKFELVITARFHGIVLAEMLKIPYIAICHHDKLSSAAIQNGLYTSYYGMNKRCILDLIDQAQHITFSQTPGSFDELTNEVRSIII